MDKLTIIFIIYIFYNVFLFLWLVPLVIYNDMQRFFTPKYLYCNTKMNRVGCYISSLAITLLFPIYCVPASIIFFIYWLFHI